MKVAANLEPARLSDPAGLHRLEAGRPDQPLDFLAVMTVDSIYSDASAGVLDGQRAGIQSPCGSVVCPTSIR